MCLFSLRPRLPFYWRRLLPRSPKSWSFVRRKVDLLLIKHKSITSAVVEASHISAGVPELKVIVRAGSGVDTIDCANAKAQGVKVCNTPGKNSVAVAELVLALILAIDRRIGLLVFCYYLFLNSGMTVENVVQFRAGQWNKEAFSECRGLKGRTLGIVGFGNIGREIAQRARAFDMQVSIELPSIVFTILSLHDF